MKPSTSQTVIRIAFLGLAATTLTGWISPPIALAAGLVFALTLGNPVPDTSHKASKLLLQWSVVGLGFGMNLPAVWSAGKTGFGFTVATIWGTLLIGYLLGRYLKVESQTSTLVSVGTSICGGSAIAAVGAVLEADARAMSVSLCTVFVLNAVALFIFPPLGHALGMDQSHFGLWSAIAIHDTSSVVGAAAKYGEEALNIATTVKLSRALWIVPIALGLALLKHRSATKVKLPWFIFAFLAAACIRTLWPHGEIAYDAIKHGARLGLTLTLFLIGAGLSRSALKTVGIRPMIQGVLLWIVVSMAGLVAVQCLLH
ncbi:MAG: putative sulfate exporter family transporter [Kiritimatiellae bacterium]|nr:putative sulfate exporter family transporter [Kiritimatiellia bacterium]